MQENGECILSPAHRGEIINLSFVIKISLCSDKEESEIDSPECGKYEFEFNLNYFILFIYEKSVIWVKRKSTEKQSF